MNISPLISIITVHRNDYKGLDSTRTSVTKMKSRSQVPLFEWVVIDGASTTLDEHSVLEKCRDSAEVFISEPDNGIYDAMNKGIDNSSGKWLLFLNAGDIFCEEFFLFDLEKIENLNHSMIWFSAYEGTAEAGHNLKKSRTPIFLWWGMPTHHQAMLFNSSKLHELRYETTYSIAADYDLVCKLSKQSSPEIFGTPLCIFDTQGISSKNFPQGLDEQDLIRERVLGISRSLCIFIKIFKKTARSFRLNMPNIYKFARYVK